MLNVKLHDSGNIDSYVMEKYAANLWLAKALENEAITDSILIIDPKYTMTEASRHIEDEFKSNGKVVALTQRMFDKEDFLFCAQRFSFKSKEIRKLKTLSLEFMVFLLQPNQNRIMEKKKFEMSFPSTDEIQS